VMIPKPGGGLRPLGILPIRGRVVQTAVPPPRHRGPLPPTGGQTRALVPRYPASSTKRKGDLTRKPPLF